MDIEIECGYNTHDETINFGCRVLADNESYEAVTLAALKISQNEVDEPLSINGIIQNGRILYNVNEFFGIFNDQQCNEVNFSCTFESVIDLILCSPNDSLVYIFLRNGCIHVLKNNNGEYALLKTVILENEEESNRKLIINCHLEHFCENEASFDSSFIIVTNNSKIFRMKVCENKDSDVSIEYKIIHNIETYVNLSAFSNSLLFLIGSRMWLLDLESDKMDSDDSPSIKAVGFVGLRMIALLDSGQLIFVCPSTLLTFSIEIDFLIKTFTVVLDENDTMKYIAANSMEDEHGNSYLYLLKNDFSILYRLKMFNEIIIITPESVTDEILYISFLKANDKLKELLFQCVNETDAEKRIIRLCRKKMFEEAERFANTHNMDIGIINIERAKLIMEKLVCSSEEIKELIRILKNLENKSFILNCCFTVESACQNLEDLDIVLKYACDLDVDQKDTSAKEKQQICKDLFFRFKVFTSLGLEMEEWKSFSTYCSVMDYMKDFLKNKKISEALRLYSRLTVREIQYFGNKWLEEVLEILHCIDVDISMPYLALFLPKTIKCLPTSLSIVCNWLKMEVFKIEKEYSDIFPQKAIEFVEASSKYLEIKQTNFANPRDSNLKSEEIERLKESLCHLEELRVGYGVKLTLKEFIQEPQEVVKILIGLDLPQDLYYRLLENFVFRFIVDNELNSDEIFWESLMDLLNYEESYWGNISAILNCMSSIELKAKAVKNILMAADLPWSDTVRNIGLEMLQNVDPIVSIIGDFMEKEQQMMVLRKGGYEIHKNTTVTMDNVEQLVNVIIMSNLPSMVSDVFNLCQDDNLLVVGIRLLFHHFVKNRNIQGAFEVLNAKDKVVRDCLDLILCDVIAASPVLEIQEIENYIVALSSPILTNKYQSLSENELEVLAWQRTVESLRNKLAMETYFNIRIPNKIIRMEERELLINEILDKKLLEYEDDNLSVSDLLNSCHRLSVYSGINQEELLIKCCMKNMYRKKELLCRVGEEFLNYCDKAKYICLLVVYLLKNLNIGNEYSMKETSYIANTSVILTCKNSGILLKLALNLIHKAVRIVEPAELIACLEIIPWVESIYFMRKYSKENDAVIFDSGRDVDNDVWEPNSTSLNAIQEVFELFISFLAQLGGEEHIFLTHYNRNRNIVSEEELLKRIKDLGRIGNTLNQDCEPLLSYKLLTTLQVQLTCAHADLNDEIINTLQDIIVKKCVPNVIQHSYLMGEIDRNLLSTALLWYSSEHATETIEKALKYHKKSPNNVALISEIAVKVFDLHRNTGPKKFCEGVLVNVSWWNRLKHLDVDYNTFFKVDSKKRLDLLIKTENFSFHLIKDYCREYNLEDVQSYYLKYLKNLLLTWKPKYEIITTNTHQRKLIMAENQQYQLEKKCTEIIDLINDDETIDLMMQGIWSQVNFYHYEVFLCIIGISDLSYKHLKTMLLFLKNYERIHPPSDTEKEKWFDNFPDCQALEPLSEFRLLFNSTILDSNDIWSVIRKEISLTNYTHWFQAIPAFNHLTIGDICSFLIKELVAQGVLKAIKPGDWLHPKLKSFFSEIDVCLQYMDKSDVKKIAAAYCLLTNTPEGADQVIIAEMTYRYAQEYESGEVVYSSTISFTKIEKKYQRCVCLQILHTHHLAEPKYIDLISNIHQLLLALYHDVRIIEKVQYVCLHFPDINSAAEQLAEVIEMDITEFRKQLLIDFLMDSESEGFTQGGNAEFIDQASLLQKKTPERSKENLIRAAYICSSNLHMWQNHLWKEGQDVESDLSYRSRCLKCLLAISNAETIQFVTSQDYETFSKYVDELSLSSILNKFGMSINMSTPNSWHIVTRRLAQICSPDSIRALVETFKFLKLSKTKYWEYVIRSSVQLNMFSELKEYLEYPEMNNFRFERFYIDAWEHLIRHSILAAINSTEDVMKSKVMECLLMIQQCPVLFFLNLESAIAKCLDAKQISIAIILSQYLSEEKRLQYVTSIKTSIKDTDLKEIRELAKSGVDTTMATKPFQ